MVERQRREFRRQAKQLQAVILRQIELAGKDPLTNQPKAPAGGSNEKAIPGSGKQHTPVASGRDQPLLERDRL